MREEIGSVLLWIRNIFRVFGISPISIHSNCKQDDAENVCICIWSCFVMASYNALVISVLMHNYIFLYTEERFALFNDTLKVVTTLIAYDVTALQSLIMRKHERAFWSLYQKLRSRRNPDVKAMTFWEQLCEHRAFIIKFVGIIVVNITFYVIFSLLASKPKQLKMFWYMFTPFVIVIGLRNAQFVLYLDLIRLEVKHLEKELILLVDFTDWHFSYKTFSQFEEFIRRQLAEKQRIYQTIFEMTDSFQNACNWSMVFHLLRGYIRMLVDGYFFVWTLIETGILIKDALSIPAILEIPMFLLTAKSCMNAAKFIPFRVHSLKHSPDNIAASVQIQNFSLQLLHQQIKIDGLGIASMDGYMLTKAIGSITTYMVFFIQFMPKFKSKFD